MRCSLLLMASLVALSAREESPAPAPTAPEAKVEESQLVEMEIAADGRAVIAGVPLSKDDLKTRLATLAKADPDVAVVIRPDYQAKVEHVTRARIACLGAGIRNLAFFDERAWEPVFRVDFDKTGAAKVHGEPLTRADLAARLKLLARTSPEQMFFQEIEESCPEAVRRDTAALAVAVGVRRVKYGPPGGNPPRVEIRLRPGEDPLVDGVPATQEKLATAFTRLAAADPGQTLHLRAPRTVPAAAIAAVIRSGIKAGLTDLRFGWMDVPSANSLVVAVRPDGTLRADGKTVTRDELKEKISALRYRARVDLTVAHAPDLPKETLAELEAWVVDEVGADSVTIHATQR